MGTAKIVALTGFAGAGKSEVAKHLVSAHGYRLMKFAEGLKDMLRAIGLTEKQIEGEYKESKSKLLCGKTPRHAMVTLGTEWGRQLIGEDLWANVLQRKIESLSRLYGPEQTKIVVDDCRFLNEAAMIQEMGGKIINVRRPGVVAKVDHPSETEHLYIVGALTIENIADIKELQLSVDYITENYAG